MLFVETRTAEIGVERRRRTPMLEALRGRGFVPLIRSARLHFFEQAAPDAEAARELERAVEERAEAEGDEPYVHGDLFCFEDYAHFLVFGAGSGLRAGVVYTAETSEPSAKLENFCRAVEEAFGEAARESGAAVAGADTDSTGAESAATGAGSDDANPFAANTFGAEPEGASVPDAGPSGSAGATRFGWRAGRTPEGSSVYGEFEAGMAQRVPPTPERARAVELLEDTAARLFLQRLGEAHADGRAAEMVAAGRGPEQESVIARLAGAGLVKREIQVSCRKEGRSLFRLPSPEALAIMTASNAVCSECGSAVADERAEELVTPTPLASSMLKDGAWLLSSLRSILAGLGVPERETAPRPAAHESEAQLTANVCGEPFLFVVRDGDFTGAHARRAVEGETEAHATHLVVVASGKVHDEARARLREHARRRSRSTGGAEVVFVEGLEKVADELRPVVERIAQEALTRELYELDADAGFDVGHALAARFRLLRRHDGALEDLAASAAGALAGSLREF